MLFWVQQQASASLLTTQNPCTAQLWDGQLSTSPCAWASGLPELLLPNQLAAPALSCSVVPRESPCKKHPPAPWPLPVLGGSRSSLCCHFPTPPLPAGLTWTRDVRGVHGHGEDRYDPHPPSSSWHVQRDPPGPCSSKPCSHWSRATGGCSRAWEWRAWAERCEFSLGLFWDSRVPAEVSGDRRWAKASTGDDGDLVVTRSGGLGPRQGRTRGLVLCTPGAEPQPQADSPAERSTCLLPCATLQPVLTTHSPASGSFTCSEETHAEPPQPLRGLGRARQAGQGGEQSVGAPACLRSHQRPGPPQPRAAPGPRPLPSPARQPPARRRRP